MLSDLYGLMHTLGKLQNRTWCGAIHSLISALDYYVKHELLLISLVGCPLFKERIYVFG